jgi:hypothetical protein
VVYSHNALALNQSAALNLTLSTPYYYDGQQNLFIEYSYNGINTPNGVALMSTQQSAGRTCGGTGVGDPLLWTQLLFTNDANVPNLRLDFGIPEITIEPTTATLTAGVWTGPITVTAPSFTTTLTAQALVGATPKRGDSNIFVVQAVGSLTVANLTPTMPEAAGTRPAGVRLTLSVAQPQPTNITLTSSSIEDLTVPETVTIPAGSLSVDVPITVINDTFIEGPEAITLTARAVGWRQGTAMTTIIDDDAAILALVLPSTLVEGSSAEGSLTLSAPTATALTVGLSASNAALSVPSSVVIPAGDISATFVVTAPNNVLINDPTTTLITATPSAGFSINTATHTLVITDDEARTLKFETTSARTAFEGETIAVMVRLPGPSVTAIPFQITSSVPGDIPLFNGTFPPGSAVVTVNVPVTQDTVADGAMAQTLTLTSPGFTSATLDVIIQDDEPHHLNFSSTFPPTQIKGTAVPVIVGVYNADNILITSAQSFRANLSAVTDSGATLTLNPLQTGPFANGFATTQLTMHSFGTGVRLTAALAGTISAVSPPFDVIHGPLVAFEWDVIPSPQLATDPFFIGLTAKDAGGNVVTSFNGRLNMSATGLPAAERITGTYATWGSAMLSTSAQFREQMIYSPEELGGAGLFNSLAVNVTTVGGTLSAPRQLTIRMKPTTANSLSSWDSTGGWSIVYSGTLSTSSVGWMEIPFTQPFEYNGFDNLLIDWSYTGGTASGEGRIGYQASTRGAASGSSAALSPDPTTWTGTSNSFYPYAYVPMLRLRTLSSSVTVTPSVTGYFTNGRWTGTLAISAPIASTTLIARDPVSSLTGTSQAFRVAQTVPLIMTRTAPPRCRSLREPLPQRLPWPCPRQSQWM